MSDTNEWKEVYVYSDTTQRALGHFSDSSRKHHHNLQSSSSRSSSLPSFETPSENSTPKVFVERTSSQILLNLPSVMIEDEGTYKCDVTYEKGSSCPSLSYIKLFVTGTTSDLVCFFPSLLHLVFLSLSVVTTLVSELSSSISRKIRFNLSVCIFPAIFSVYFFLPSKFLPSIHVISISFPPK